MTTDDEELFPRGRGPVADQSTPVSCDQCDRVMYRATASGIRYAENNTCPIKMTIGHRRFLLCTRRCMDQLLQSLTDAELREGGWPLPW